MNFNRRLLLKQTAMLTFALGVSTYASEKTDKELSYRYSPQFYIGNPNAQTRIDFLFSLRCKDTRKFTKDILHNLVESAYRKDDLCIVFHHIVKDTKKELDSAIELMNIDPNDYPDLMYTLLSWSADRGKGIHLKRAKKFKKKLKYSNDDSFDSEIAKGMLAVLRLHADENKVTESPSIFINGKLFGMQLDKEAFLVLLEDEAGYTL